MKLPIMIATVLTGVVALAQDPQVRREADQNRTGESRQALNTQTEARARELRERGARFLLAAQQKDGGWESETGPGITCIVLKALIREPSVGPDHEAVRRGLEFVGRFQREDGGIYGPEGLVKNYESSVALSMYSAMVEKETAGRAAKESPESTRSPGTDREPGRDAETRPDSGAGVRPSKESPGTQSGGDLVGKASGPLAERMERLRKFIVENQWDEGEGKSIDDPFYGGAGYGRGQRPDLSNTQIMLDALHDSGLPPDHPAYRKALVFIGRCQMLGEYNDQPFARGSSQGGFIYSPVGGGESKAGDTPISIDGGEGRTELRSYGSMTYAGFKSMLYAGLSRDDPRVRAALDWIRRYWTLEYNPNMPERQSREGLYYYYHTFARALAAWAEPSIADEKGERHDWRAELVEKLAKLQRSDGSWANEADRWMEGRPALTTAYSVLALQGAFGEQPVSRNSKTGSQPR